MNEFTVSMQTPDETVPVAGVTAKANFKRVTSHFARYHTVAHLTRE
jgi:hypothetical protein